MDRTLVLKNIIYITHAEKKPSGGAKIIYRHSAKVNSIKNFSSQVLHIKKKKISKIKLSLSKRFNFSNYKVISGWQLKDITPVKNFKYTWFNNKVLIKENFNFNKNTDFVVIPEIFAHLANDLLIKKNIEYSIFVQNGYVLKSSSNDGQIIKAYKNSKFIMSYSKNITDCIKLKFPMLKKKIVKISCSIPIKTKSQKKIDLITYMSRKLPNHSNLVIDFLKNYLPKKWKIKNIDNLDEFSTYKYLNKSKIFLSFSSFEGLGLPPAEAALAGNYVIGYTGEGGKEYWSKPIFKKINNGDIITFVKEILKKINCYKRFPYNKNSLLIDKFSEKNELKNIKKFLKLIK